MLAFIKRNFLDRFLWLLCLASLFLMFKSSTDPRPNFIKGTFYEEFFKPFTTGNQITFDITVGIIVSLFVYVLVVRLPAWQKKNRLKAHLLRRYDDLKEQCIIHFLWACKEPAASDLIQHLKSQPEFKIFFSERVSENQDRWHAVLNGLNEDYVRALVQELDAFRNELDYTLTSVDVTNEIVFSFLRHLTQVLQRTRNWTDKDAQLKPLSQFMWSVFSGWNIITGYPEKDVVCEMISAI